MWLVGFGIFQVLELQTFIVHRAESLVQQIIMQSMKVEFVEIFTCPTGYYG